MENPVEQYLAFSARNNENTPFSDKAETQLFNELESNLLYEAHSEVC
jgi:hypothetical protein